MMDTVKWVTDNLEKVKAPEMGINYCGSGEKDGKTYGTITFHTFDGCEKYWVHAFFNNHPALPGDGGQHDHLLGRLVD